MFHFQFLNIVCNGGCLTKAATYGAVAHASYGCCVFPFIYSGVTYNKCSDASGALGAYEKWCAFEVSGGVMVTDKWAYCSDYCKDDNFG